MVYIGSIYVDYGSRVFISASVRNIFAMLGLVITCTEFAPILMVLHMVLIQYSFNKLRIQHRDFKCSPKAVLALCSGYYVTNL